MTPGLDARGLWIAIGAFVLWGVMPLYWHALKSVPSLQIVLHRVVWGALLVGAWLLFKHGRHWLRDTLRTPRAAWLLAVSGVLIAINWGLYIWAVNAGHVVESSLGYYINPLLSVALGVVVLKERMTPLQWTSVALAGVGVVWLTLRFGQVPWIALSLACSFAIYGLIRKVVAVDAVRGLGVEGAYLLLPGLALIVWSEMTGRGGFVSTWGVGIDAMLVLGGALTALPLIGFAYAVRRVPLSVVGLLQYIAPSLQFLIGVLVFKEPFGTDRAIGFACIWVALAIFAVDGWRRAASRPRRVAT